LWIIVVAIFTIAIGAINGAIGPPTIPVVLFVGSCLALFTAIGLWVGVDNNWRHIPLQLVGFALVVSVLVLFSTAGPSLDFAIFLMSLLGGVTVVIVATPIIFFRVLKNGSLKKPQPGEFASFKEVMQFGLTHLIILTTVVAVLISVGQWLANWIDVVSSHDPIIVVSKLGLSLAIGSVVSVWATLGRRPLFRTALAVLVAVGVIILNYFIIRVGPFQWAYAGMTLVAWVETMVLLWCLRIEGYRFVSRPRNESVEQTKPIQKLIDPKTK
jgi:hypothetical protein